MKTTFHWRGFLLAITVALTTGLGIVRADNLDLATPAAATTDLATAENDPAAEADEEADAENAEETLNDLLALDVQGGLRRSSRNEYVRVRLENISDETVEGPVYLVVKSTGIDGLQPGRPVQMLAAGEKIRTERFSRPKTVRFQSDDRLTMEQRAGLDLGYELVRELDAADVAGTETDNAEAADGNGGESLAELNERYGLPANAKTFPGKNYGPRQLQRVMDVKSRSEDRLFAVEGVHGVGVGEKDGQLVVQVLIDRLGIRDKLPATVNGIPVDARVAARVRTRPAMTKPEDTTDATAQSTTGKYRPLRMGISTNNYGTGNNAGTLGFFGKDSSGNVYGITNRHVVGHSASTGNTMVQPARLDGGTTGDKIGAVHRIAPYSFGSSARNTIDAATLKIDAGQRIVATNLSGIRLSSTSPLSAYPGLRVQKYGRTTDLTTGEVTAVGLSIRVDGNGFINQIRVKPIGSTRFSSGGDSGSLVFSQGSRRPVGLHFAGNGTDGFSNPASAVLSYFGLTAINTDLTVGSGGPKRLFSIRTWSDTDRDGIQDSGEPSLNGVRVWAYNWNTGVWTSTLSSGGYAQFNLTDGHWFKFWVGPPTGYSHSPADRGSNDNVDSDFLSNHYTSQWYRATANQYSVDCGLIPPAPLRTYSIRTWKDSDGDGLQDSGESSLSGVRVWMYDYSASKWTSALSSGGYAAFSVREGQWYRFWVGPPTGYSHSPANRGSNDGIDSDFATNHYTGWYKVNGNNYSVDCGLIPPPPTRTYTIRVWRDSDRDGLQDSGESSLSGVRVWMYDYSAKKWTSVLSNGSGLASFSVKEGQWYIFWVGPPSGYAHSPANRGSNDSVDSDFLTTHYTGWYKVSGNNSSVDCGLTR